MSLRRGLRISVKGGKCNQPTKKVANNGRQASIHANSSAPVTHVDLVALTKLLDEMFRTIVLKVFSQ